MRKVVIKLDEKDYLDFLQTSNGDGLSAEEKIYEIINYYLIIERKKKESSSQEKNGPNYSRLIFIYLNCEIMIWQKR